MDNDELHRLAHQAMLDRGMQPDFSDAAQRESAALVEPGEIAETGTAPLDDVRDLRDLLWCSIDNDDSLDLDQLTVAQPEASGTVRLLIAIADVDVLVRVGGAIDEHARINTTSVYTAAGVFPMLPTRLSTGLTSLNEGKDRAAIVIEVVVDGDAGDHASVAPPSSEPTVYRAIVRNKAKLAYNSVAAWLDGNAAVPQKITSVPGLEEQLRLQDCVGQQLKEQRRQRGALGLDTPQSRPVFTDGVLTDLRADEGNRAKELIAGFMIAANAVTARFLDAHGFPSLRRFLREPQRWQRIRDIAAGLNESLPEAPSSIALDAFLTKRRIAQPDRFAELSLTIVKLLGSGEYMLSRPDQKAPGHFGLAVNDYTHSTAPNRRYPDLITQRLLKAAMTGAAPPLSDEALTLLAQHCTEQEDNAAKVERQVRKSAAALLLQSRIGEKFAAVITGVSSKGTWVRTTHPVVEGRVVDGFEGLDVGDKPQVQLVSVDARRGFIDFKRVG
jgi:VacB/RNase II family 3'-5' exoribonuclease